MPAAPVRGAVPVKLSRSEIGDTTRLGVEVPQNSDAANLFRQLVKSPTFPEFLTLLAYDLITADVA